MPEISKTYTKLCMNFEKISLETTVYEVWREPLNILIQKGFRFTSQMNPTCNSGFIKSIQDGVHIFD